MTREEAIETLGHVVPFATQNGEKIAEAIDMAIEALRHDRKNINKTDAAEILQKYVFDDEECIAQDMKDYNEALKIAIEALSAEETIEIEPMEIKDDFRIDNIDENRRSTLDDIVWEDIVWVVRCKNCRHWYKKMNKCNRCPSISGNWGADDFCSWGERIKE